MNIEHYYNNIRYTLSNDNLEVGDKVFPIAIGRRLDNGGFILSYLEFEKYQYTDFETDFPNNPHIITKIEKDNIYTNHGYSHPQVYYKIIKREHHIKENDGPFSTYKWIEIK